jgi:hypothetical protein
LPAKSGKAAKNILSGTSENLKMPDFIPKTVSDRDRMKGTFIV